MKASKLRFCICLVSLLALNIACTMSGTDNVTSVRHNQDISETSYTYPYREYGFSITAPCKMEDVSQYTSGDFLINLGGITDKNDSKKIAAYQFMVTRLPVGYRNIPASELSSRVDELLRITFSNLENLEAVKVGYEGFPGYVGYSFSNGLRQKGMIFSMNNYIIALTVMTNNNLEEKFNRFSNGFKVLKH